MSLFLCQKYIVSCRGVVQLGGLVQGSPGFVPPRLIYVLIFIVTLCSYFLFNHIIC